MNKLGIYFVEHFSYALLWGLVFTLIALAPAICMSYHANILKQERLIIEKRIDELEKTK